VQLVFSKKALADLKQIHEYSLINWSLQQADQYYFQLIDTCKNLLDFPKLGKHYSKLSRKPFGYKVAKHVVFYKIVGKEIRVIRILHESMDLKKAI